MTRPEGGIAVVGVGAILPGANGAPEFWKNVVGKVNAIREVPRERWDAARYWDPDPRAPDKTYSKIGGFVEDPPFDSIPFRIPPKVALQIDGVQKLALLAAKEAIDDAGLMRVPPERERVAVILGNSMGGENRDRGIFRVRAPDYADHVRSSPAFQALPRESQERILAEAEAHLKASMMGITEDSLPGGLSNVIAGRIANVFDFAGKSCTIDAACASTFAALDLASKTLRDGEADVVLCGGADRSMDAATYVKFAKVGALSPDGSRPFDATANGFVMGEGAAVFVLKREEDARAAGERTYGIVRGLGSSSDGRGKGITAPNPRGQELAIRRAYAAAGVPPGSVGLIEAHGTSTPVGDVVEVETLARAFEGSNMPAGSVAIGSVKSQIGHLKSAAGAAGLLKTLFALSHRTIPPTLNVREPNPRIPWAQTPFALAHEPRAWHPRAQGEPRRAGVSAFGFGGTNYHVIVEEAPA